MKKGFTLVEMLSVVVVLGLLAFLVVPSINNVLRDSRSDLYESQLDLIKNAARIWASEEENKKFLENFEDWPYEITLGDLQKQGFIEKNIENPLSDEKIFHENMIIQINKLDNSYEYLVLDEIDPLAPVITLNGESIQNVEIRENYEELGATVVSSSGEDLTASVSIRQSGAVVESIDTNTLGIYKVVYSATDGQKDSSLSRIVRVVDTTSPVLTCDTCPVNNVIYITVNEDYELPTVTATDNSGEVIEVYKTGSFSAYISGERTLVYTATDSSGNKATMSLKVVVSE